MKRQAVVYDFSPSRAGEHALNFLGAWNGKLVWRLRQESAVPIAEKLHE
jgi:hypothetical protein